MNIAYLLKPKTERRITPFIPETILPFGQLRTDHMFVMDFNGDAWINHRIIPYQSLSLMPGAIGLNYGQEIFEGLKAFQHQDEELYTFRMKDNTMRMKQSAKILSMADLPVEMQCEAIHALLDVERLWFPQQEGASLYIRPIMFATQDSLGVKPSKTYTYCIFLSPSGPYYAAGLSKAIKILITETYHRAVRGGSGAAKASGNYAPSLRAMQQAASKGAQQVLYLDANNQYIEEAGMMGHFHITTQHELIVPSPTDTILSSITSDAVCKLASSVGLQAKQKTLAIKDFIEDLKTHQIIEAGGLGTAAVISPVSHYLLEDDTEFTVGEGTVGPYTLKLYQALTDIQFGRAQDPFQWLQKVERVF